MMFPTNNKYNNRINKSKVRASCLLKLNFSCTMAIIEAFQSLLYCLCNNKSKF